jgi:uncharacterized protein (TIGR02145 family)
MDELVENLGGSDVAGGKLKEAGTKHWIYPNTDADNSSGFTALPGGTRGTAGFHGLGEYGSWWAGDIYDMSDAWGMHLHYNQAACYVDEYNLKTGRSVRCVKD